MYDYYSKEDKREKSGYRNYQDYLETMEVYGFHPMKKEFWDKVYIGKDEWESKNKGKTNECSDCL